MAESERRKEEKRRAELLDRLIVAICADYERRRAEIEEGTVSPRVKMEYKYMNSRVFDAAGEISGGALAEIFINEIGNGTGYSHSKASGISESAYKIYKKEIKSNIARKLSLKD